MNVAAIILAAGSSSRMGQPKQLLDWHGQPLVRVAAQNALASTCDAVYVVVGAARGAVIAALDGMPVTIIDNPAYASGQASSLRAGVSNLPDNTAAAIVALGDQPFVSPAIINTLVATWLQEQPPIVAPSYRGQRGNPVLFARSIFPELLQIEGDQGARQILQADPARIRLVHFDDTRPLEDIDSPEDYQRIQRAE